MERITNGFRCEINVQELPIRFSLFDLYSWSWFWLYKKYRIEFPSGPNFRLLSCSAVLEKETREKAEWLLIIRVDHLCEYRTDNSVTLVVPWRRECERISFAVMPTPQSDVTIKTE
jgi:hypothetical protein